MKDIISSIVNTARSSVTIDGVTYRGNNIQITGDGKVVVDGVVQEQQLATTVNIVVEGNAGNIKNTSGSVRVNDCQSVQTVSGDVEVANSVRQDVNTVSGDVNARIIYGAVKTVSGDVTTRK